MVPMTAVKAFEMPSVDGKRIFKQARGDVFHVVRREDWNRLRRRGLAVEGIFTEDKIPTDKEVEARKADVPPPEADKAEPIGYEKRGGKPVTGQDAPMTSKSAKALVPPEG